MQHYFISCIWLLCKKNLPPLKCQLFRPEELLFKIDTPDILKLAIIFLNLATYWHQYYSEGEKRAPRGRKSFEK